MEEIQDCTSNVCLLIATCTCTLSQPYLRCITHKGSDSPFDQPLPSLLFPVGDPTDFFSGTGGYKKLRTGHMWKQ